MKMDKQQFIKLVLRHRAGDRAAQTRLYEFLHQKAKGVYHSWGYDSTFCWEEVEQQVLDKIVELFNYPFEKKTDVSPLNTVKVAFKNLFIDYYRKVVNSQVNSFSSFKIAGEQETDDELDYLFVDSPCYEKGEDENQFHYQELRSLVKKGISRLGVKQAQVLELVLIENMPVKEILDTLKITRQQYDNNKLLGLRKLGAWLKSQGVESLAH